MQPNRTKYALLGFLSRGESSAYKLGETIAASVANFWRENDGRVYPILARMETEGLVTSTEAGTGGRKSRVYRITGAGLAELDAWLAEDPVPRPPRSELLLKIFFGYRQDPETLIGWLDHKIAESDLAIARYATVRPKLQAMAEGMPDAAYWLMTMDYGEKRAHFERRWARDCKRRLRKRGSNDR